MNVACITFPAIIVSHLLNVMQAGIFQAINENDRLIVINKHYLMRKKKNADD